MDKSKRWVTPSLERIAFEDIITTTFRRYKDNLMCSNVILEEIIQKVTEDIRGQLQGLSQGEK